MWEERHGLLSSFLMLASGSGPGGGLQNPSLGLESGWLAFLILEPCNPPATSCIFLQFPAMCPLKTHLLSGKCIFLQESAFFCGKVHSSIGKYFSAGKCIFLQFALGVENHEC